MTSIWCLTSRFDVGSSSMSTLGSWARPLAIRTFCSCPELSSDTSLSEMAWMCRAPIARSATSRSLSELAHWANGNLPIRTVSATVVRNTWSMRLGTYAILRARSIRRIPSTSSPSRVTLPAFGFRSLFRHLTRVVLPTPLGPMTQTSSGRSRVKDTPLSTGSSPYPKERSLTTSSVISRPPCCCAV